jgi:hypothetical protein
MKYFEELDAWLSAVLLAEEEEGEEEWFTRVKKQLKEKILESYRNGQKAGLPPARKDTQEDPREPRTRRPWPPRRSSQRQ